MLKPGSISPVELFTEETEGEHLGFSQSVDACTRACGNREYADPMAYDCIHMLLPVRDTDLSRFPHPALPYGPAETLGRIRSGLLGDGEAAQEAYAYAAALKSLHVKPLKTRSHTGVSDIALHIPPSLAAPFGKLLLICEAHLLLNGEPQGAPLFRRVTGRKDLGEAGLLRLMQKAIKSESLEGKADPDFEKGGMEIGKAE